MHLYFLEAVGCFPVAVKIGISSNVKGRIAQIQTSMPFKLQFLGCVTYPSAATARTAERKLHKKLKTKRLNGEWFKLTPKTREFILGLIGGSTSMPAPIVKPVPVLPNEPNYILPPPTRDKNGRFRSGISNLPRAST